MSSMASKQLALTPAERLFRQCLLDCRGEMQSTPGMKDLVLRWTGGWVRDKLLGVQSHDIDVALSTMTGEQFGLALQQFMQKNGAKYEEEATKIGLNAGIKGLHKIEANPEKSKNLETINTRVFGIDVDFVNLRKEIYHEDSRIPQMEFGTAQEDAMRRDATVNALFYNLDLETVEDFTKQGLDDMDAKIIRTPLAPYETFKDDPLRVLRLIRFACRLEYEIDGSCQEAMKDKTIHEALRLKISRERIGVEIGKIMVGPDPYTGLKYINDFDLYGTVFGNPADATCRSTIKAQLAYDGLQRILNDRSAICLSLRPKNDRALSWFLATYVPWSEFGSNAAVAAREGIKATNNWSRILNEAISARPAIVSAIDHIELGTATRGRIGMSLRASKDTWQQHVLYSLLCDIVEGQFDVVLDRYERFLRFVNDEGLSNASSIDKRLVLKGNEIKDVLGVVKQGPWMKTAVNMVAEWQFDQESKSVPTRDQAVEMIRGRKKELGLG